MERGQTEEGRLQVEASTRAALDAPGRSALHEEVEVGSGEFLMDGLQQEVPALSSLRPSLSWLRPRSSSHGRQRRLDLGGVGEAEGRAVNQAVGPEEGQGDGDGVSHAAPSVREDRDIGNDAEQRPGGPEET